MTLFGLQFSVQLRRNLATAKNAKPLDNAAEVAIIKKLRDQRIDNAEQYRMAGRQDLYDNEMAESLILNEFLPQTVNRLLI